MRTVLGHVEPSSNTLKAASFTTERPDNSARRSEAVYSILGAIGVLGGVSALASGLACIIIHAMMPADQMFNSVGTVLIVAAIPMLLGGSVCMDAIAAAKSNSGRSG